MNKSKFFTSTAVVAIVALGVAGCHQASSWPELSNVVPCVNLPTQIPAEELGAFFEELRCDARGSTVVFPDGKTKPIKSQLTTSTAGDDRDDGGAAYYLINGGSYGLAAAMLVPGDEVQWFGSEAAIEKVQYRYGQNPFDRCFWWWPWPDC